MEEEKKMKEKTKGEEAVMTAWSTETGQAKPETNWFHPKPGSVIPKKRRLVQSMILDYALLKLSGSASTSASAAGTGKDNRVYPDSADGVVTAEKSHLKKGQNMNIVRIAGVGTRCLNFDAVVVGPIQGICRGPLSSFFERRITAVHRRGSRIHP
ncbi:hypothetical protein TIFTF001_019512 [Ficus carica]|uniref:Uncharacterized protein n=1 Tax=Ficus carica TaxID=3494 RepID=A0AA88AQK5_FICCA|nr:hypothetical protein TIFTF001_019512 [Ficus carica]